MRRGKGEEGKGREKEIKGCTIMGVCTYLYHAQF